MEWSWNKKTAKEVELAKEEELAKEVALEKEIKELEENTQSGRWVRGEPEKVTVYLIIKNDKNEKVIKELTGWSTIDIAWKNIQDSPK